MQKNIGIEDRIIRFVLAIVILAIAFWRGSWILAAISLFVFYEAFAGWCALYQLIGKNTCRK